LKESKREGHKQPGDPDPKRIHNNSGNALTDSGKMTGSRKVEEQKSSSPQEDESPKGLKKDRGEGKGLEGKRGKEGGKGGGKGGGKSGGKGGRGKPNRDDTAEIGGPKRKPDDRPGNGKLVRFEKVEIEWDGVLDFPAKLRGVFNLMRPFTLLAPLVGGIMAALLALMVDPLPQYADALSWPYWNSSYPWFHWTFPVMDIIWGVGTLVMVNAASNTINQVYDLEIDRINKPRRPIPMGIITPDEALSLSWILYLITLWRAATFANGAFATIVLVLMLFTILYSVPPARLKKRLWISNLSIALPRGLLGFVAGWSILGNPFNPLPWFLGLISFLFLIGATTTKDFTDSPGDRKFGIRTLPVVFGVKKAIIMSAPFLVLPFFLIPIGIWNGILIKESWVLMFMPVWGLYLIHLLFKESKKPNPKFENSATWFHMYVMLITMFIAYLLVTVLGRYVL